MNEKFWDLLFKTITTLISFAGVLMAAVQIVKNTQETRVKVAKEKSVGEEAIKQIKHDIDEIKEKISEHKEDSVERIDKLHDKFNDVLMRMSNFLSK